MAVSDHVNLEQFMQGLQRRNPGETEFHQAVYEVAANVFGPIGNEVTDFSAKPDSISPVGDDAALALGFYRGKTAHGPFEIRFAHLAHVDGDAIVRFEQFTDTHQWQAATAG